MLLLFKVNEGFKQYRGSYSPSRGTPGRYISGLVSLPRQKRLTSENVTFGARPIVMYCTDLHPMNFVQSASSTIILDCVSSAVLVLPISIFNSTCCCTVPSGRHSQTGCAAPVIPFIISQSFASIRRRSFL